MKQSFFPDTGLWRKGNIHSHTTRTDGLCPPEQQIRDYHAHGYDFLSITDHNVIDSHQLGKDVDCFSPTRRKRQLPRSGAMIVWRSRISNFWTKCGRQDSSWYLPIPIGAG